MSRWRPTLAVAVLALLLAGCGYDATEVPEAPEATPEQEAAPPAPQNCVDPTQSYAPDGTLAQLRNGRALADIRDRGRLVAGVSADSYRLGSRDPISGDLEGFDIDMVEEVARAIFQTDEVDDKITYRVITAADRIPALQQERVDIVARNMTINCERWRDVAFSAVYYQAGQKILVRLDLAEDGVDSVDDLGGLRVCAPDGTTSEANIREQAPSDTVVVTPANHTDCLVLFQRGDVDAITGDDTVLAGLAAQDPYAVVPTGQEAFSEEPYGIAINLGNADLVRFVNAVLEQMRADGSWQESYDEWLRPALGQGTQPQPTYGRTP